MTNLHAIISLNVQMYQVSLGSSQGLPKEYFNDHGLNIDNRLILRDVPQNNEDIFVEDYLGEQFIQTLYLIVELEM